MESNGNVPTVAEQVDNKKKFAADLDQALNIAGTGIYNLKYSLVLALFLIAAIVEPVGYSYVLPAARCDLNMSDAQRGFIASVPYIGIVITSYPWGYLVDTQGRKRIVVLASVAAGIFGVLSAFMPNLISFIILKFLTALCIAAPAAVPYSFIGEIIPQKHKDMVLSIVNALQILGSAIVPLLAWIIIPLDFRTDFGLYEFRPWRLLTIANSSFFLIAAFFMSFGPESPKYLVSKGKNDEALQVLRGIYAGNKRKSPENYPVKTLKLPPAIQNTNRSFLRSLKEQTLPLLKAPYNKWLALIGFLLFGVFATLNGLYVWVPDILNRVLDSSVQNQNLTACGIIRQRFDETDVVAGCVDDIAQQTFIVNLVANSCCAIIAIAGSSAVKIVGKKLLLFIVFVLIGTFCILINFITQDMAFAALLSSFPITGMTIGPINAFAVDIFPTELRGMAISLAMMIGRLGSVVGANIAGILLAAACEATFYIFGGLLLLCAVSTFVLPRSGARRVKTKYIITKM